jgi:hypothetical protein
MTYDTTILAMHIDSNINQPSVQIYEEWNADDCAW